MDSYTAGWQAFFKGVGFQYSPVIDQLEWERGWRAAEASIWWKQ